MDSHFALESSSLSSPPTRKFPDLMSSFLCCFYRGQIFAQCDQLQILARTNNSQANTLGCTKEAAAIHPMSRMKCKSFPPTAPTHCCCHPNFSAAAAADIYLQSAHILGWEWGAKYYCRCCNAQVFESGNRPAAATHACTHPQPKGPLQYRCKLKQPKLHPRICNSCILQLL